MGYGGRYDVKEHNPKLHEQFEQKTNVFTIQDLDICLFYGNEVFSDHYGMTINFEHSTAVLVTLRITARCTVSQQCNTIIQTVDATENQGGTVHLKFGSFGLQTSLSTMVCEVQIIRMLTDTLYEYPLKMTQSAFLMEWTISSELLDRFKQCIRNDEHGMTFESRVFYDMFKLRCHPNKRGYLKFSLQAMALPTINGKGTERLSAKCILSEPTTKTWGRFDCVFGYDDASSSYRGAPILKNQKVLDIEEGKELKFRMEVVIEPEDDDDEEQFSV